MKPKPYIAPKVPEHLQPETAAWFSSTASKYKLRGDDLRLLALAAESWDRCQQARTALAEHGLVYLDRFSAPRTRPEVAVERDSRLAFARLIRQLAFGDYRTISPRTQSAFDELAE